MEKKDAHDHESKEHSCCGGHGECACEQEGMERGCGCAHGEMKKVKITPRKPNTTGIAGDGDVVLVHYTGTLDSGETFDSSEGREPIEFVLGEHAVIRGFEEGVAGMKVGDKKKVTIEPEDAYGDVNPQLQQEVPKEALGDIEPEVGMMLALHHPAAPQPMPVKIVAVGEGSVTIDMNHPLAGQRLHFDLELVEIK